MSEARLLADIPPKVVQLLKDHGIFACHSIVPPCNGKPYAEVIGVDGETRHLFCRQCTVDYCIRHGITFPTPPEQLTSPDTREE